MSDGISIKVFAEDIRAAFRQLPDDAKARIIGYGTKKAGPKMADAMADEIRTLGLRGEGHLADSIGIKTKRFQRAGTAYTVVGPVSRKVASRSGLSVENPARYAHLVYGGVKRHTISTTRPGGMISRAYGSWPGGIRLGNEFEHPGQRARQFGPGALSKVAPAIINDFHAYMGQAALRFVRRANRRAGRGAS